MHSVIVPNVFLRDKVFVHRFAPDETVIAFDTETLIVCIRTPMDVRPDQLHILFEMPTFGTCSETTLPATSASCTCVGDGMHLCWTFVVGMSFMSEGLYHASVFASSFASSSSSSSSSTSSTCDSMETSPWTLMRDLMNSAHGNVCVTVDTVHASHPPANHPPCSGSEDTVVTFDAVRRGRTPESNFYTRVMSAGVPVMVYPALDVPVPEDLLLKKIKGIEAAACAMDAGSAIDLHHAASLWYVARFSPF